MLRKTLPIILGAFMIVSVLASNGMAISNGIAAGNGVSKVTVTFDGNPKTARGFTWYTDLASTNSDLQVVEKRDCDFQKDAKFTTHTSFPDFRRAIQFSGRRFVATNSAGEFVHNAEATGLKPDTTYFFRVGDAALNIWSEAGTFQTASKKGSFTFVDIADTQANDENEAILASETIAKALATVSDAKFFALNGDIVDTGSNEQQWNWLFIHSQQSLLNTTILPVAGNHEAQKNAFIDHFDLKQAAGSDTTTGAYYSVNYHNAHFILLNTNENSVDYANFTPAQIHWLKDDVKAAKRDGFRWLIAILHKGPYTTSNHATDSDIMGPNGVRTMVAPILSELGIDLVLQGHDHIYARSKPIQNGMATQTNITKTHQGVTIDYTVKPDGTIYLIPGTAGPKVYYKNKSIDRSYFGLFDVADENHAALYGPDPSDATRPARSQIQNFEAITVGEDKLTVISYEIDQSKNSAKPYLIDLFGIIKDIGSSSGYEKGCK